MLVKNKFDLIYHNNKEIIHINYQGLTEEQGIQYTKDFTSYIMEYGKNNTGTILVLVDMRNYTVTSKHMEVSKQEGKITGNLFPDNKTAVLGVTGIRNVLLKSYNFITGNKMNPFNSEEEALEWLTRN